MKLLLVVTVLVACGTYDVILLQSMRCWQFLHTSGDGSQNDGRNIWKNREECLQDGGVKINDDGHLEQHSRTHSIKYSYPEDLIPTTPGNNTHYVEGKSRYIWMPDGKGRPHLVDLHKFDDGEHLKEKNNLDIEYWLYTRKNPEIAQEIVQFRSDSLRYSNFNRTRPIKVIVHGWISNGLDAFSRLTKTSFLSVQDLNVIIVDWRNIASCGYPTAVQAVPEVGRQIAQFLSWLMRTAGASWDNVHIVGFSMGAHIAGSAGRFTGGKPSRITGLDPAGPLFHGNPDNMSPRDAQYVEAIHTDGDRLGHFGSLGQADFYVNGGRNPQPGCVISTCSHSRVVDLFAATIRYNHLVGRQCDDIKEAEMAECAGREMKMGNAILSKRGSGIYGVKSGGIWPY